MIYYSINKYFDFIVGVDNYIADGKIERGGVLMEKINCKRSEIILIGDTNHDYEVAQNLKIDCLLISHGHQSSKLLRSVSHNVVKNFNQLFE